MLRTPPVRVYMLWMVEKMSLSQVENEYLTLHPILRMRLLGTLW